MVVAVGLFVAIIRGYDLEIGEEPAALGMAPGRDRLDMRTVARRTCYFLTFALFASGILAGGVLAHVDAVTGQDYQLFQRRDGGGDCCEWYDCRPATAPFVEPDGEKIMDRAGNKYRFDARKVVTRPSDDGNWHICGDAKTLKCIIAPAEG